MIDDHRPRAGAPTRRQALLLKAALLAGAPARDAWSQWFAHGDITRLDPGSQRLLPLLYRNLLRENVATASESLKRAYLATLTRNQLLIRELGSVLAVLHSAGIETILLKGAALTFTAYKDRGTRPMADVDILVPVQRAGDAIAVLESEGWRSTLGNPRRLVGVRHADEFTDVPGRKVDLHWSALQECCRPGDNDDFWAARRTVDVNGTTAGVLCPADQLLHVCAHGTRSTPHQPVGWIADAAMVINASPDDLDWDRLLAQATRRRLIVPLRYALHYLTMTLRLQIPTGVLDRMDQERTSRTERLEHAIKIRRRRRVGSLPVLWFDYARWTDHASTIARIAGFPRYLQITFRTKTLAGLPLEMLRLTTKRLRSQTIAEAG